MHERRAMRPLVNMAVLGLPTLTAVWPWLWHDTFTRLQGYLDFHRHHDFHPTYYFAHIYTNPPAPWHFPPVMQAITTPLPLVALIAVGLGVSVAAAVRRWPGDGLPLLLALNALVPAFVTALPSTPTYDNTRLFLATSVFLAAFAGLGYARIVAWLGGGAPRAVAVAALALGLSLAGWARVRPYTLSYYGLLVGGPRGALSAGMESTYWGEACNMAVVTWLNANIPDGSSLDTNSETYGTLAEYQRLGMLKPTLRFAAHADYWVLTAQQGYSSFAEWWPLYEDRDPAYRTLQSWGLPGVRLVWVVERR